MKKNKKLIYVLIGVILLITVLCVISFILKYLVVSSIQDDPKQSVGKSEAYLILNAINDYCIEEKEKNTNEYCKDGIMPLNIINKIVKEHSVTDIKISIKDYKVNKLELKSNDYNFVLVNDKIKLKD